MSEPNKSMAPVSESTQQRLKAFVEKVGMREATKQIGCSSHVLTRAAAGFQVNAGTRALLERWESS